MKEKKQQRYKDENKARILIVDDHAVVRDGLRLLIDQEPDLVVCASVETAEQAIEAIEKQLVDLAIVDISLNGTSGIELTERIKLQRPLLPVLILTIHDEVLYAKRSLRAGAGGYITKHESAETIITAIRLMLNGEVQGRLTPEAISRVVSQVQETEVLTPVE